MHEVAEDEHRRCRGLHGDLTARDDAVARERLGRFHRSSMARLLAGAIGCSEVLFSRRARMPNGIMAGGEPASRNGGIASSMLLPRRHEVVDPDRWHGRSRPILGLAAGGAKVSMMSMARRSTDRDARARRADRCLRPSLPQAFLGARRHGRSARGRARCCRRDCRWQKPIVSDAMEPFRQDVHQVAPDELVRVQRHRHVPARSVDPIILAFERDAGVIGRDEPAVGDGDAVSVA